MLKTAPLWMRRMLEDESILSCRQSDIETTAAVSSDLARLRTHNQSQKMTVAAMQIAEKKVWAHRS